MRENNYYFSGPKLLSCVCLRLEPSLPKRAQLDVCQLGKMMKLAEIIRHDILTHIQHFRIQLSRRRRGPAANALVRVLSEMEFFGRMLPVV